MLSALLAAFLVLLAAPAQAQRDAPSPVEVRSAYCISVLNGRGREAHILASLPAPRALQEGFRQVEARYQSELRLIRAYIVPRMKYLDPEALLAATDRGQADVNAFIRTEQACRTRCDMTPQPVPDPAAKGAACYRACAAEDPASARVEACSPVTWLVRF